MKSITRFAKRALSLVLCLTMVMTTMLFFDIGITKSEAAVSVNNPTASSELPDVLFYVPEAIYLRPVSHSWGASSKSKFHFFVENKVTDSSGNLLAQPETKTDITTGKGKVYFKYANGTFKNLEIRWLSADMLTVKTDGGDLLLGASGGDAKLAGGVWAEISRDMESPTLSASESGCILEWKLTYHDNADNLDKVVVAYTYVYKPYVVAITTGIKAKETYWDDHEIQHISWISGIHNVVSEATSGQRYARYGASARTGAKGFMPFLTAGNLDGINGSSATGSHFGVKDGASPMAGANTLNEYFASTNTSYDYFYADQSQNNNNQNAWDWHVDSGSQSMTTTESGTSTFNKAVHVYSDIERDTGGTDDSCVWKGYLNNSLGGIYIDVSRYKDLSQVPNLGIGLRITKSEGADNGSWYVADYTGRSPAQNDYYGDNGDATWNSYFETIWTDMNYSIAGAGNKQTTVSQGAWCETKYAGTWPRALTKDSSGKYLSEATYKVRMTTYAHRGEDATIASSIMQMKAWQYDKTNLRTAVNNAIKESARLGLSGVVEENNQKSVFKSHYYNNSGAYTAFIDAFKLAYASLIYVDMAPTATPDTLATNLNNALSALKSDTASRKTGTAHQYNIGLMKNADGTYRVITLPGTAYHTKDYKLRDKVEFTEDTYEGFTFKGVLKMHEDFGQEGAKNLANEEYTIFNLPTFSYEGHLLDHQPSQFVDNNNKKTTTFEHIGDEPSVSTKVATYSGSTVTYPYIAESTITYCYFYEFTQSEILFGNDFDFDYTRWLKPTRGTQVVDRINNTITLTATERDADGVINTYSGTEHCSEQLDSYMTLIPGRAYRFSMKVRNDSDHPIKAQMFLFTFKNNTYDADSSQVAELVIPPKTSETDFVWVEPKNAQGGSGAIEIPLDTNYATLRVGFREANDIGDSVTFKDICVRDITTFLSSGASNTIYLDGDSTENPALIPLNKTGAPGSVQEVNFENGTAPKLKRSGYQFVGWSEDHQANGNGGALVTSTTIPANGNKKLYPVWRTNVTYNTGGGSYRADPINRINYKAEGRFNLDVGTAVAVSNRGRYERDDASVTDPNWNSTDLNYSYVPYRFGYNFNGWKVTGSIDSALVGQTFWPGETVPAEANVELTADWVEADAIGTALQIIESTNNGDNNNTNASLYPGQIEFYSFTPTQRNMYVSAFTFGTNVDTEINWFNADFSESETNNNAKEVADQYEYENSGETFGYYGLLDENSNIAFFKEVNSLFTKQLTKNEKSYYGVSLHNLGAYTVNTINFRIREHKVVFDLNPNEGNFDGSYANQQVDGFGGESTELTTDIKRHGYVFSGWQTENREEIQKEYTLADGKCVVPGEDNTIWLSGYTQSFERTVYLKAKWTAERFTLIYDGNRGSASTVPEKVPSSVKMTYDSTFMLPEEPPEMKGYTFKGWSLDKEKPEGVENETLYTKTNRELSVAVVNSLYDKMFNASENSVTLYARWAPNLILVHFKPSEYSTEEEIKEFRFDEQKTLDPMQFNEAEQYTVEFYNEGVKIDSLTQMADLVLAGWTNSTGEYKYYLNDDKTLTLLNPNGETGNSDTVGTDTYLYAFWKNAEGNDITDATTITSPVWERTGYVLAGWADPNDTDSPDTTTVDYAAGSRFVPQGDMQLHAVWHPKATADTNENLFDDFDNMQPVIQGVIFNDANDLTDVEEIVALEVPQYNPEKMNAYKAVVKRYQAAKAAFEANKSAENNNELYASIRELESFKLPTDTDATAAVDAYLSNFKIEYAPGVEGKVPAGTYSLADMNLNHYTEGLLKFTKDTYDNALTVKSIFDQKTINDAVIALAQAYANKQTLEEAKTTYQLYETAGAINASGLKETLLGSEDITAVNYVYTGKGNYTYYCYTNTLKPKVVLTVDEATDATATVAEGASAPRVCYPTKVKYDQLATSGLAESQIPVEKRVTIPDSELDETVLKYLSLGLDETAADYEEKLADRKSHYATKAAMVLEPDFSKVADTSLNATVTYTLKAHNDAFAGKDNENIKYADAAALASGAEKGKLNDIPQGEYATNKSDGVVVTPENTITILIDYHVSATDGSVLDVNGKQVQDDAWLKQYHLIRSAGGADNWDMVKRDDAIYTNDDPTYGQSNFGSFTYTFRVGGANDFANCVLTSSDVKDVVSIVKDHYNEIRSVAFTKAKTTTRFAHEKDAQGNEILDSNGNPKVYIETVPAGTGLGFKEWPQTTWSYNYYPASQVYTYVHIVDRWGNVVDKVIETPNVDANAVQFLSQSVGDVTAVEVGGSGIDTMSFSAKSFDIIPDENSTFDGTTYTTTGNTVKLYTGEANKTYNLTANDVAANASKGTATTDADGYLTITVEDLAFDTQSGAYTFTLNDKTINLYAEVEDVILSAEDVTVDAGEKAIVSVTTTTAPTMVQLVSASGTTATAIEYTEDEDGNRVWQIGVKMSPGSYEYEVRSKVDGKWISEGETVTVTVIEPTVFVGAVTAVEYTPSTSTRNEFMFTVTGRPDKIQVIEPDGGTRTYDRYHAKVVIVSYDAEGNVIGSMSRELSYEVWTIEMNVPADIELTAIARYGRAWSTDAPYKYTVVLATPEFDDEVYSMELASTEGRLGKVQATVITGLDVRGVRFEMDNDTTTTYYTATEADGKLTYVGNAWMNHYGENIIIVKIRVNNAWLNAGELTYLAI